MKDEFYDFFKEKYHSTFENKADDRVIQKYSGVLPNNLLEIWKKEGWSGYFNGLLWLVNPEKYEGIIEDYFSGTELQGKGDFYCIAKGAFGGLLVFEANSGTFMNIDPVLEMITVQKNFEKKIASQSDKEISIISRFSVLKINSYDITNYGNSMFDRAFKKHGHLSPDEIYGFEPLLSLGGEMEVSSISKLYDVVHLSIIRQFTNPVVKYF